VQVTRSKNVFSLLQSVCGVSDIRVFTALTVMVIISRMRRRVVWQAHKFRRNRQAQHPTVAMRQHAQPTFW